MIAAAGLRWILTLLFAVSVVHGVWRAVLPGTRVADRVDHTLHAAMGVLMAAMAWPWGMDLSAAPQVVLFSAGALWFAVAALLRFRADGSRIAAVLAAGPHVVMTAAMAWMVAAMDASGSMAGHSGGGGMHEMHMAGADGLASMSLSGTGPRLVAGVLAAVLAGIGLVWLTRALDLARAWDPAPGRVPRTAAPGEGVAGALAFGCHASMALGMAVMFVLLV